mmetsp:Transcript_7493/g.22276  ORF Transcript_7493/g.22276 Transcript_7493/m.22276 type:complete len:144 (-) Transcript_7493:346-777(-)
MRRAKGAGLDGYGLHPLLCVDPVQPANNVGKTCYRISCIQKLFRNAAAAALDASEEAAPRLAALASSVAPTDVEDASAAEAAAEVLAKLTAAEAEVIEALFCAGAPAATKSRAAGDGATGGAMGAVAPPPRPASEPAPAAAGL